MSEELGDTAVSLAQRLGMPGKERSVAILAQVKFRLVQRLGMPPRAGPHAFPFQLRSRRGVIDLDADELATSPRLALPPPGLPPQQGHLALGIILKVIFVQTDLLAWEEWPSMLVSVRAASVWWHLVCKHISANLLHVVRRWAV